MYSIDLNFANERQNHLLEVSKTEHILRQIRQNKFILIHPNKRSRAPGKPATALTTSEAQA
jgi:hypothetical protein